MDGQADGAQHALCRLRPWSLACPEAVEEALSPHLSNHDSRLTVATIRWRAVGRVPERSGWSHMAAMALHSSIDVKCARRLDCPGELRRTIIPVPAPQAGGVTSRSTIDVKCARHFDYPRELRCTTVPVATRSWCAVGGVSEGPGWSHVAAMALHSTIDVKCVRCPGELRRTGVPVPARRAGGVASRSAIDVKCTRRVDYPGELRGMDVPVLARKASDVASRSAIDVKCSRRADCPGELSGIDVPVPARKVRGIASRSAPDVGPIPTRRRGDAFHPR
jgi:hypothetical protein